MKIGARVLVAVTLASTPASAQWIYQGTESAFGDAALHLAITGKGDYGFAIRCRGGKIEAAYITPDTSFNADTYEVANVTGPKLRIRVDKNDIIDLDAALEDIDGKAAVLAQADVAVVDQIRDAKSSVAVVLQILGENYHENSFNVRGSTKAIDQLIAGCGLAKAG